MSNAGNRSLATSPREVAKKLGMPRGAISKLVDRVVAQRLVKCAAEKADRRFQSLAPTPAGRELVPALAARPTRTTPNSLGI